MYSVVSHVCRPLFAMCGYMMEGNIAIKYMHIYGLRLKQYSNDLFKFKAI